MTVDGTVRCEACGARNVEGAAWCTQCYAPFGAAPEPPAAPAPPTDPPPAAGPDSAPSPADGPEQSASGGSAVEVGNVRELDGVVEWRCVTCGSWTPLELASCATCGAPRSGFGDQGRSQVDVGDLDADRITAGSLALPGLGHVQAGRTGSGVTRMVLALLWLLGGVWWLAAATTARLPGAILVVGALILWIASFLDVRALLARRDEPFGVRGLLWLVVGVTALLMVAVAMAATGPAFG